MNKKATLFIVLWLSMMGGGFSQSKKKSIYTLQDCIDMMVENNLELKITELRAKASKVDFHENRNERLPSVMMNYNLGINNGRSIDPFTNSYINQKLTFSNAGLQLDATIFNGFRIKSKLKQSRFNWRASEVEIDEIKQRLILEVTLLYIEALKNREALQLSRSRLRATEVQLKRLKNHYNHGSANPADYTDMQGQLARDQSEIITNENRLKTSFLNLIRLLGIEMGVASDFANILDHTLLEKYQTSAYDIYQDALNNLATFKVKQLRVDAAKTGIKIARANFFPKISLFGQLNTNYSSAAALHTQTGIATIKTNDFVSVNGQKLPVFRNEEQFESSHIDFREQFNNNLNSVVGISVRVPIFNGSKTKNKLMIEKINYEEAKINLKQTKFSFKQAIQEAHNHMEASFKKYQLLKNQVSAYEASFRVNEVRFNHGVSNIVAYINAKNNMEASKLNLIQGKYEYVLRVKILEYYRGM